MDKQTLDIQQMQHLQELGLELKETMMYWARCVDNNPRASTHYGKWVLIKGNSAQTVGLMHWEFVPAYTLQDVLSVLPKDIKPNKTWYFLRIDLADECIYYYCEDYQLMECRKKVIEYDGMDGLIDAAYELLVWCIENKYVETIELNKSEKGKK